MVYANWEDECTSNGFDTAKFETQAEYNKILQMISK